MALNLGDSFTFNISDFDSELQSLNLRIDQDLGEVESAVVRTDFDTITFSSFELVDTVFEDNFFSGIFERIRYS